MGQQHYRRWAGEVNTRPAGPNDHLTRDNSEQPKIDFAARIDSVLTALNDGVVAYQEDNGKVEKAKTDAQNEVFRLQAELEKAEKHLQTLISLGTAEDHYTRAVCNAERELQILTGYYTQEVEAEIIRGWYGQDVARHALGAERKSELKLHKRVSDLKRFNHVPIASSQMFATGAGTGQYATRHDVKKINQRVDQVGQKLTDLREHIEKDSAK
jgi:hypothetical protein